MDLKPVQAGPTGFEPATIGLKARRSTWLSYRPNAHLGRASDRTSFMKIPRVGFRRLRMINPHAAP